MLVSDLHHELRHFLVLSVRTDELLSTPKIITFLPQEFKIEKSQREPNPMPYPECEYLSRSAFLVNLAAPNKQSFGVKTVFKPRDHASSSQRTNKFTTFLPVKVTLSCFKQLLLNLTLVFELLVPINFGERL